MSQQIWVEDELDADLHVDISNLTLGSYPEENGLYDEEGMWSISSIAVSWTKRILHTEPGLAVPELDEATLASVQHQIAQQAAFAQIPEVVKRVRKLHS